MWKWTFTLAAIGAISGQTLWAPKGEPGAYTPPHRPLTKLGDVKARHAGQKAWRELVVDDNMLRSEWIQAPPGARVNRAMHPDTRTWWVVMEGEVKFDIETVPSFVAGYRSMVQCPMQTFYSWEVVGDKPALIFETNVAGAKTLYESETAPPPVPGLEWTPVKLSRVIAQWLHGNKPHVRYEEAAARLEKSGQSLERFVQDDRAAAHFIYTDNAKLPPLDEKNLGHYHPEGAEYWLILQGPLRFPIERIGVKMAETGDVIYIPPNTFHAPRAWGSGPTCRLAMNGFPFFAHLTEDPKAKARK